MLGANAASRAAGPASPLALSLSFLHFPSGKVLQVVTSLLLSRTIVYFLFRLFFVFPLCSSSLSGFVVLCQRTQSEVARHITHAAGVTAMRRMTARGMERKRANRVVLIVDLYSREAQSSNGKDADDGPCTVSLLYLYPHR